MKKKSIRLTTAFFIPALVCFIVHADKNIQFVTGAPVVAPDEPSYSDGATAIDWLAEPIAGNYYVAVTAPVTNPVGTGINKTIAVYRFIPGSLPTTGTLEFIASAPTGQCIFDAFTQQDVCDESFNDVKQVSWFPHAINGEYFFTVVGVVGEESFRLGVPGQQSIRVYRFNPDNTTPANGTIDFIDSAPLQASEGEPPFVQVNSVDWFDRSIDDTYYFAAVGGGVLLDTEMDTPQVRVYSFDPNAPLGTNLSFVGEAANDTTDPAFEKEALSVAWLPELVDGNSYCAVGGDFGFGANDAIRVYQFCPGPCQGTSMSPENHVRLIATAPTSAVLDSSIAQASSVRWLVVNGCYYLAAAVDEATLSPFRKARTVRIYEFIPGADNPTLGRLRFVTSAPVGAVCCDPDVTDAINNARALDWLTKDGNYYLLVGGKDEDSANTVQIYQFDDTREKLTFVARKALATAPFNFLSYADWFPGSIDGHCYFGISIGVGLGLLNKAQAEEDFFAQIFTFRPPCSIFPALSC